MRDIRLVDDGVADRDEPKPPGARRKALARVVLAASQPKELTAD